MTYSYRDRSGAEWWDAFGRRKILSHAPKDCRAVGLRDVGSPPGLPPVPAMDKPAAGGVDEWERWPLRAPEGRSEAARLRPRTRDETHTQETPRWRP
jgi:hypothetical protein